MDMCISNIVGKRAESPRPDEIIALVEPPEVVKVVKARGTKRCLLTAFGDKTYTRERTPDGGAGSLVLPPLRLDGQDEAMAGEGQSEKGKAAAESGRPSAALRLSVRAKKACMDGGSSMHNSAELERELSLALLPDELDTETMFSVGACLPPSGLRTPPRTVCRLELDLDLSPLQGLRLFDRMDQQEGVLLPSEGLQLFDHFQPLHAEI
jgi:hypothetical protein